VGSISCDLVDLNLSIRFLLGWVRLSRGTESEKKADVVKH